jgi:hypothetical protein
MINISYILFAFIAIISALLLIIRRGLNTILILAQLLLVFIMASFQFLILDFYYLGLTYIIVYVGAIAILFLFVIMLIQTDSPILPNNHLIKPILTSVSYIKSDILDKRNIKSNSFRLIFIISSFFILSSFLIINPSTNTIIYSFINLNWFSDIITLTDIQTLGYLTFLGNPLIIIIIGILLWLVLIGILCLCQ